MLRRTLNALTPLREAQAPAEPAHDSLWHVLEQSVDAAFVIDARHRVVALSSPRADEPVPAWTRHPGQARDFNALFQTVAFETGERALVADRSGRGMAMRVQDRLGPCVRSVEE